jgi:hypothetical protein
MTGSGNIPRDPADTTLANFNLDADFLASVCLILPALPGLPAAWRGVLR